MTRRLSLIAVLAVAAVVVAAVAMSSGTGTQARAAGSAVAVAGKEFKFTLSKQSARHGRVTFRLTNRGKIGHDFKIDGKKTPVVSPGKTAAITANLTKPGRYTYLCTVPGHAASGMRGVFRVS